MYGLVGLVPPVVGGPISGRRLGASMTGPNFFQEPSQVGGMPEREYYGTGTLVRLRTGLIFMEFAAESGLCFGKLLTRVLA